MDNQQYVSGKRVLVTGGAGFIGSNLCDSLISNGNWVTCLDNFATGKRENIEHLLENPKFRLIEGDICNLEMCKTACEGMDILFHQAAIGSVPRSIANPIYTNDVNISGFLNMLVAARDAGIKRIVYACSSSTYGDSEQLPKVEDKIGKPLSPYAVTKYVNELYADVFSRTYDMELVGLRYFNVFGMRQDPDSTYAAVIPKFVASLLSHNPITINGDGSYSRDFTHVSNVILANNLAATTRNPEAVNQIYNVACGEQTSLNQLVEKLITSLVQFQPDVKETTVIHGENRIGDIPHSLASIDKAKRLLGYAPKMYFNQGIDNTCLWYYENIK
jgi:UDP-N-acetylglucosamine/UDP-N-acetylgalactosamine 4-epimerase